MYKVQGLTVRVPNCLVADIKSMDHPAESYVTLSRVQRLSQLFILSSMKKENIKASADSMKELERMNNVATNLYTEPCILSCNIRSLTAHLQDLLTSSQFPGAEVVCLQETWLSPADGEESPFPSGLSVRHNSVGRGKGITTLFCQQFTWEADITENNYQVTKIKSAQADVINFYRSYSANDKKFIDDLSSLITVGRTTLVVGDANICFLADTTNPVFQFFFDNGFTQLVKDPTHLAQQEEHTSRLIDVAFLWSAQPAPQLKVQQQAQYFTDHTLLKIVGGMHLNTV